MEPQRWEDLIRVYLFFNIGFEKKGIKNYFRWVIEFIDSMGFEDF